MSMRTYSWATAVVMICLLPGLGHAAPKDDDDQGEDKGGKKSAGVQVGPRPYFLVSKMTDGPLKRKLESCSEGPFYKTDFSIGHRGGGTLQFPEHTKESHLA